METKEGGVCYQNGEVINHNYQICDVTNKKITDLLGEKRPQVTFTCKKEEGNCDFQCRPVVRTLGAVTKLTCSSLG